MNLVTSAGLSRSLSSICSGSVSLSPMSGLELLAAPLLPWHGAVSLVGETGAAAGVFGATVGTGVAGAGTSAGVAGAAASCSDVP